MKSEKTRFILTVLMVSGICAVFALGCYLLYESADNKRQNILVLKNELLKYEGRTRDTKILEKTLVSVESRRRQIEGILYGGSLVNFIEELEYLAKKAEVDLEIISVDFNQKSSDEPVFRLNLGGSFLRLYHFIYLLENEHFQVELGKLFLNRMEENSLWNANLEVGFLSFNKNEF